MRLSSGERKVRGFQPTDPKNPVRAESGSTGVRDGMGLGMGEELPPFTERRAREFAWVRQHLPDEHEGMAVSALISIQTFGDKPTKESVLSRLRAQGRTAEQMRRKGWIE